MKIDFSWKQSSPPPNTHQVITKTNKTSQMCFFCSYDTLNASPFLGIRIRLVNFCLDPKGRVFFFQLMVAFSKKGLMIPQKKNMVLAFQKDNAIWSLYHSFTVLPSVDMKKNDCNDCKNPCSPCSSIFSHQTQPPCLGWHCWSPKLLQVKLHSPSKCPGTRQNRWCFGEFSYLYMNLVVL